MKKIHVHDPKKFLASIQLIKFKENQLRDVNLHLDGSTTTDITGMR